MAAVFLKNPTIAISADEAKKLAMALQNLSKQYSINVSPVLMAWLQLAGVSAAIYGPRIALNITAGKIAAQKRQQENTLQNAGTVSNAMGVQSPTVDAQPGKMKFQ